MRRFADAASLACLSQMSSRPASDVRNDRGVLDVASELVSDAYDRNLARRSRHSPRLLPSGLTTRIVEPPRTQMVVRSLGRTESARLHRGARGDLSAELSSRAFIKQRVALSSQTRVRRYRDSRTTRPFTSNSTNPTDPTSSASAWISPQATNHRLQAVFRPAPTRRKLRAAGRPPQHRLEVPFAQTSSRGVQFRGDL